MVIDSSSNVKFDSINHLCLLSVEWVPALHTPLLGGGTSAVMPAVPPHQLHPRNKTFPTAWILPDCAESDSEASVSNYNKDIGCVPPKLWGCVFAQIVSGMQSFLALNQVPALTVGQDPSTSNPMVARYQRHGQSEPGLAGGLLCSCAICCERLAREGSAYVCCCLQGCSCFNSP
jgi:hypothetical protein